MQLAICWKAKVCFPLLPSYLLHVNMDGGSGSPGHAPGTCHWGGHCNVYAVHKLKAHMLSRLLCFLVCPHLLQSYSSLPSIARNDAQHFILICHQRAHRRLSKAST
jgi:hypothetical protein